MANKEDLLKFLNREVFDPILRARPEAYDASGQRALKDVQDRTRSEKERFHRYRSAREVVDNFKDDLTSSTAKRVNAELERLHLPTLPGVKSEFLELAGDAGADRGSTH